MEEWIQQELPGVNVAHFVCNVCGSTSFNIREIVYYSTEVDNKSKIVEVDGSNGYPDNTRLVCSSCDEIFTKEFEVDWI